MHNNTGTMLILTGQFHKQTDYSVMNDVCHEQLECVVVFLHGRKHVLTFEGLRIKKKQICFRKKEEVSLHYNLDGPICYTNWLHISGYPNAACSL